MITRDVFDNIVKGCEIHQAMIQMNTQKMQMQYAKENLVDDIQKGLDIQKGIDKLEELLHAAETEYEAVKEATCVDSPTKN